MNSCHSPETHELGLTVVPILARGQGVGGRSGTEVEWDLPKATQLTRQTEHSIPGRQGAARSPVACVSRPRRGAPDWWRAACRPWGRRAGRVSLMEDLGRWVPNSLALVPNLYVGVSTKPAHGLSVRLRQDHVPRSLLVEGTRRDQQDSNGIQAHPPPPGGAAATRPRVPVLSGRKTPRKHPFQVRVCALPFRSPQPPSA